MCGIAGIFSPTPAGALPDPGRLLLRMLRAQAHRGPDGAGMLAEGGGGFVTAYAASAEELHAPELPASPCVLGHNWLAIQDTSQSARQPMTTRDGKPELAIVFNGEIYNFVELREELVTKGAEFRTESDTEVLLELWRREGVRCLPRLRGMYAFAVYDRTAGELWLVRDPFGIKPLYLARLPHALLFASEIRSLHASGCVARTLRPAAALASAAAGVNHFGPTATLYEGIEELPPGHWLCVRLGDSIATPQPRSHYRLPPPEGDLQGEVATDLLRGAVRESIRLHLRSRRRIATCLSGGLDSSTIAWLVAEQLREAGHPTEDFSTFTICTAGPDDSELEAAALVARRAGLRHRIVPDPTDIPPLDVLEMTLAYEVPNHVIGPINQFLVLREIARSGATVVLDGQGGDELLSGYPWYAPVLLAELQRRGQYSSALQAQLEERLPLDLATSRQFDRMFHDPAAWVEAFMWQGRFLGWSREQVLELPETQFYLAGGGAWQSFREREYFRAELHYLLRQEDRLGMWFGLECRVPLVDVPLVDVASRLAPDWLLRDGYLKYPFRVMLPELPDEVRWNHRKRGFWETDRGRFPWVAELGRTLAADSPCLRELFPSLPDEWPSLSFDQHWRLLQLAVLERYSGREGLAELAKLCASTSATTSTARGTSATT